MLPASIMIIEDETIIAKDIENILLNHGYKISGIFSRAEDAIESLNASVPDLILMDVVLKGDMDGIEAADLINKKVHVPIIFITAYADDITISRIKKTDPYGYFLKPFEEKELQTWIETTLHKFETEKHNNQNGNLISPILEVLDTGIIVFDSGSCVVSMNNAAEKITQLTRTDVLGKKLKFIFDADTLGDNIEKLFSAVPLAEHAVKKLRISAGNKAGTELFCNIVYISRDAAGIIFNEEDNNKIAELKKKLDDSYKEVEKFAYFASHDLQEPLRMVASYVQLLKKRYNNKIDKEANEFIDFAVSGTHRMKGLIDDLLLYSRINAKHFNPEEIDCTKIVEEITEQVSVKWKKSNPVIKHEKLPVIYADTYQIYQLFHHLITNSIKFNVSTRPQVDISCKKKNGSWKFTIRDNGIGIEKQYHEKIFEAFQRLHNHKDFPGTGIGLAVCKKIVEMHGGEIGVESKPEKGTTFYFTLNDETKS